MGTITQSELTTRQKKLIELGDQRHFADFKQQELIYVPKPLLLFPFPFKPVTEQSIFKIVPLHKGKVTIQFSTIGKGQLPFGKDMVQFVHLFSFAFLKNQQTLLFDTIASFTTDYEHRRPMGRIGGKDNVELMQRIARLRDLRIMLQYEESTATVDQGKNFPDVQVIESWRLPKETTNYQVQKKRPEEESFYLRFDDSIWNALRKRKDPLGDPVPLWAPLMRMYQNNPKAWNFVAHICWRSFTAEKAMRYGSSGISEIPLSEVSEWLGAQNSNPTRFKATLDDVLDELKVGWHEHRCSFRAGTPYREPKLIIQPPKDGVHLVRPRQFALLFQGAGFLPQKG